MCYGGLLYKYVYKYMYAHTYTHSNAPSNPSQAAPARELATEAAELKGVRYLGANGGSYGGPVVMGGANNVVKFAILPGKNAGTWKNDGKMQFQ